MNPRSRAAETSRGRVVRYGSEGDALVELDADGVAWARNVVPGDEGDFTLRTSNKRVDATLVRLQVRSPHRVDPACGLVDRCGGCPTMIADPVYAREQKRLAIVRAIETPSVEVAMRPSPSELGYRRRARFAFDARPGDVRMGYRPPRSEAVVDVTTCPVLDARLARAFGCVRERLGGLLRGKGDLRLALGTDSVPVLALRSDGTQSSELYAAASALVDDGTLAGSALFVGGANRPAISGDPVERTPCVEGGLLEGTVDGFSQANDAVALEMAACVRDFAEPDGVRVLELYAGHGHLSIGLASRARSFVAVEQAGAAAEALRRNLRERAIAGRVITADAADAPRTPVDVVVLDPPRTGAKEALAVVLAAAPRRIVMASCDPRSLQRDLRTLVQHGYRITRAVAFDMFPGTAHVESVVRLDRSA